MAGGWEFGGTPRTVRAGRIRTIVKNAKKISRSRRGGKINNIPWRPRRPAVYLRPRFYSPSNCPPRSRPLFGTRTNILKHIPTIGIKWPAHEGMLFNISYHSAAAGRVRVCVCWRMCTRARPNGDNYRVPEMTTALGLA